jgi:hypothetical protein
MSDINLIPCDLCDEFIEFNDYERHTQACNIYRQNVNRNLLEIRRLNTRINNVIRNVNNVLDEPTETALNEDTPNENTPNENTPNENTPNEDIIINNPIYEQPSTNMENILEIREYQRNIIDRYIQYEPQFSNIREEYLENLQTNTEEINRIYQRIRNIRSSINNTFNNNLSSQPNSEILDEIPPPPPPPLPPPPPSHQELLNNPLININRHTNRYRYRNSTIFNNLISNNTPGNINIYTNNISNDISNDDDDDDDDDDFPVLELNTNDTYYQSPSTYEDLILIGEEIGDVNIGIKNLNKITTNIILEEDTECFVCREDFKKDDTMKQLLCTHYFCDECVTKWFANNKKCPICNMEFEPYLPNTEGNQDINNITIENNPVIINNIVV